MLDYTELVRYFGGMGFFAIMLWKAGPVIWTGLILPWSNRLMKFFDKLEATMDTTVTAQQEHKTQNERHEDLSWRIYDSAEGANEKCDRIIKQMGMPPSPPNRTKRRKTTSTLQPQPQAQPPDAGGGGGTGSSATSSSSPPSP